MKGSDRPTPRNISLVLMRTDYPNKKRYTEAATSGTAGVRRVRARMGLVFWTAHVAHRSGRLEDTVADGMYAQVCMRRTHARRRRSVVGMHVCMSTCTRTQPTGSMYGWSLIGH
jgi:hypothetical protein